MNTAESKTAESKIAGEALVVASRALIEARGIEAPPDDVTRLLTAWREGDEQALDRLMPLVEEELHRIAVAYMAVERRDHTLQPTALVNEVYLRLVKPESVSWQNRAHFLGFAALAMKRILVDHARKRQAKIRNEGVKPLPLDELRDIPVELDREIIAVDDALRMLYKLDRRQSQAVELFHFAGLTYAEIGEVLGFSEATAKRALRAGRAWLRRAIRSIEDPHSDSASPL